MTFDFEGFSIPDFIHYIFCHIFILQKEPVFLDWGLNPGPPALEASTIPLGYRGGGLTNSVYRLDSESFTINIGYMKLTPILLILVKFIIQLGRPPA